MCSPVQQQAQRRPALTSVQKCNTRCAALTHIHTRTWRAEPLSYEPHIRLPTLSTLHRAPQSFFTGSTLVQSHGCSPAAAAAFT
jgi:hypothetical protein